MSIEFKEKQDTIYIIAMLKILSTLVLIEHSQVDEMLLNI